MTRLIEYFNIILPEIDNHLLENKEKIGKAIRIKSDDDIILRKAIFTIAKFFRKEFYYSATQYAQSWDKENDNECFAYLWTIDGGKNFLKSFPIGGFCFRKREWGGFGFQWIWIHPYVRNKNLLKTHWGLLEEKFGDFYCEPPYSSSMMKFLQKNSKKSHYRYDKDKHPEILEDKLHRLYKK